MDGIHLSNKQIEVVLRGLDLHQEFARQMLMPDSVANALGAAVPGLDARAKQREFNEIIQNQIEELELGCAKIKTAVLEYRQRCNESAPERLANVAKEIINKSEKEDSGDDDA